MTHLWRYCCLVASSCISLALCAVSAPAYAQALPAVSAPNGEIEFSAGMLNMPASPPFLYRAAGAFSLPLSRAVGVQFDLTLSNADSGGAIHVFTRDPSRYLGGFTAGFIRFNNASLGAAGPEAELYFNRLSIKAWGGFAGLTYDDPTMLSKSGMFASAELAYYPQDNLRLNLGASTMLGYNSLHLGAEYLFAEPDWPFSVSANARLGQDGAFAATLGLKFYLGGPPKSLIARHRQDDPGNAGIDLARMSGTLPFAGAAAAGPVDISEPETETPGITSGPDDATGPEAQTPVCDLGPAC